MAETSRETIARFRLYITGHTSRSERAIVRAHELLRTRYDGDYELVVIDSLERPDEAARENIIATPILVRVHPLPSRRLLGDMSDYQRAKEWIGSEDVERPIGEE